MAKKRWQKNNILFLLYSLVRRLSASLCPALTLDSRESSYSLWTTLAEPLAASGLSGHASVIGVKEKGEYA